MAKYRKTAIKERKFVDQYLIDLNAKQAAIRAGFPPKSAHVTADRLLKRHKVAFLLSQKLAQSSKTCDVSSERILREYARLAFYDIADFYDKDGEPKPLDELHHDQRACIVGVRDNIDKEGNLRREYRFSDKIKALDSLARYFGILPPDQEVNINVHNQAIVLNAAETGETLQELESAGILTLHKADEEENSNGNGHH